MQHEFTHDEVIDVLGEDPRYLELLYNFCPNLLCHRTMQEKMINWFICIYAHNTPAQRDREADLFCKRSWVFSFLSINSQPKTLYFIRNRDLQVKSHEPSLSHTHLSWIVPHTLTFSKVDNKSANSTNSRSLTLLLKWRFQNDLGLIVLIRKSEPGLLCKWDNLKRFGYLALKDSLSPHASFQNLILSPFSNFNFAWSRKTGNKP